MAKRARRTAPPRSRPTLAAAIAEARRTRGSGVGEGLLERDFTERHESLRAHGAVSRIGRRGESPQKSVETRASLAPDEPPDHVRSRRESARGRCHFLEASERCGAWRTGDRVRRVALLRGHLGQGEQCPYRQRGGLPSQCGHRGRTQRRIARGRRERRSRASHAFALDLPGEAEGLEGDDFVRHPGFDRRAGLGGTEMNERAGRRKANARVGVVDGRPCDLEDAGVSRDAERLDHRRPEPRVARAHDAQDRVQGAKIAETGRKRDRRPRRQGDPAEGDGAGGRFDRERIERGVLTGTPLARDRDEGFERDRVSRSGEGDGRLSSGKDDARQSLGLVVGRLAARHGRRVRCERLGGRPEDGGEGFARGRNAHRRGEPSHDREQRARVLPRHALERRVRVGSPLQTRPRRADEQRQGLGRADGRGAFDAAEPLVRIGRSHEARGHLEAEARAQAGRRIGAEGMCRDALHERQCESPGPRAPRHLRSPSGQPFFFGSALGAPLTRGHMSTASRTPSPSASSSGQPS